MVTVCMFQKVTVMLFSVEYSTKEALKLKVGRLWVRFPIGSDIFL